VVERASPTWATITTYSRPRSAAARPRTRRKSTVTIALDPVGSVRVTLCSVPQGRGTATVAAQIVADVLGRSRRISASSPTR